MSGSPQDKRRIRNIRHKLNRLMSLIEAATNVVVGYVLAVATQFAVFRLFGLAVSTADNLLIGGMFTIVSLLRSYALRRLFEAMRGPRPH